jgi:hypothetical protein
MNRMIDTVLNHKFIRASKGSTIYRSQIETLDADSFGAA